MSAFVSLDEVDQDIQLPVPGLAGPGHVTHKYNPRKMIFF
jgi:hypothetical protein